MILSTKAVQILSNYYGYDRIEIDLEDVRGFQRKKHFIMLYDQRKKILINNYMTNNSGKVNIENIDLNKGPFFLVAHDPVLEFNGVIADNIDRDFKNVHEEG